MRNWYQRLIKSPLSNNKIFKIFLFFLVFVSTCLEAQNPAVKIYVADAETAKNISNAKVCLEGFEIPAIKAQYNKKEKYYYFTEIPKNYNTVMVYHKKYNEKGFQDINGLPKELKFKLHEPLQNYYDFVDFANRTKKHHFYVEDSYKIVIRTNSNMTYSEFKNKFYSFLETNKIEIEPINPSLKYQYNKEKIITHNVNEAYPELKDCKNQFCVFPLIDGYDNYESNCRSGQDRSYDEIVFFFRKKDKSKFKRFNDPIIRNIEKTGEFIVYPIIYYKRSVYDGDYDDLFHNIFNPYKNRDKENIKYNNNNKIDSSEVFFYNTDFHLLKKKKSKKINIIEPNNGCNPQFKLVEKNNCYPLFVRKRDINIEDLPPCLSGESLRMIDYSNYYGLGLGILDIYENYNLDFK